MNKLRIRVAVLVGCSILLTFLIIAAIYNVSTRSYLSSEVKKSIDNIFVLSYENYDESYLYIPECFYIEERLLNNSAAINSHHYSLKERRIIEWCREHDASTVTKAVINQNTYYIRTGRVDYDDDLKYESPEIIVAYIDVSGEPEMIAQTNLFLLAAAVIISIFGSLLGLIFGKKIEESQLSQKLFFENTSHELKTPLTSIRGYAEGMERGVITDYQKTGSVIISQTEKMSRLIDDILLMAKLESGSAPLEYTDVEVSEFVQNCLMPLEGAVENRCLAVELRLAGGTIRADENRLDQAFSNLLVNAIRYAKSRIVIVYDGRILSVSNDCDDVEKIDTDHIFERFYTGQNGSTGVGLALAKDIIELHKWKIRADKHNNEICVQIDITNRS